MNEISKTALVMVSLVMLMAAAAADTIQVQNVHVNSVGTTIPVNIVLDSSTAGIAGYDITVSLSNSSVGMITDVSFPSWAILNQSTYLPSSSARLRTVDLYEQVNARDTNVLFGTITLRGDSPGSTDVIVTIKNVTADDGEGVAPASLSGKFTVDSESSQPIIADHASTDLSLVPLVAINHAKTNLHIAYGHSSHGSQIITGMNGLTTFSGVPYDGSTFAWNSGGTDGALDMRDTPFSGVSDLGNPDYTSWATATRTYLNAHTDVNVIMWSWCGQVSSASDSDFANYLPQMNQLEIDYPNVMFVYMTGHLDGSGESGTLNQRNEQIRAFVRANNKILYDFADIESYDPDGLVNYMKLNADDNCDYTIDSVSHNWANEWQSSHTEGVDWFECSPAHTQALNGNQKAFAAWWLWARLAGWDGVPVATIEKSKLGVFRNGLWVIDYNGNYRWDGPVTDRAAYLGQTSDIPVVSDWNGDGKDEAGIFRNGLWVIDYNGNYRWDGTTTDRATWLGQISDIPVVGDWNGDRKDEAGIFRNGLWVIDYNGNYQWDGTTTDRATWLGQAGDVPVVGDWNGDGKDEAGIFRNGLWVIDYNGNYRWDGPVTDRATWLGQTSDIPVVSDWNGDGKDEAGIFRNGLWVIDYNGNYQWDGTTTDRATWLGQTGDIPVVGDWNGDGKDEAGIFRNGLWVIDYNGNYQWDGTTTDRATWLGQAGDTAVIGKLG